MIEILRFAQPAIIAILGALIVVWIVSHYTIKVLQSSEETVSAIKQAKLIRNAIIALLSLAFIWQLVVAISVNNVNRSVIDRSGVNTQRYEVTATPVK